MYSCHVRPHEQTDVVYYYYYYYSGPALAILRPCSNFSPIPFSSFPHPSFRPSPFLLPPLPTP